MTNDKDKVDPSTLIEISLNDFEVANMLFDRKEPKYYPQAIYMLQQSLEKAIKAVLVCTGLVKSEKELIEKIGHKVTERTLKLLPNVAKESIINIISFIIQNVNSTNEETAKNFVWELLLKNAIPALNNLKPDEMVNDINNEIKSWICQQQINNKDAKELAKIIIDRFTKYKEKNEKIIKEIFDSFKNFCITDLSINITQFNQHNVSNLSLTSLTSLLLYTLILLVLHAKLDDLQAKLRYHSPKINEDEDIYRLSMLTKEIINTQINNKNILENLKELINNFKDYQISNYVTT
jgi:HEPN domain-containing protein